MFERGANAALVQKVAYSMSLRPPAVAVPSLRSLLSMDLAGLLPTIHVPVYAINSDLLPTDAARIRRSLPDFHLDVLDHTGHFLMLEDPARFNALLLQQQQQRVAIDREGPVTAVQGELEVPAIGGHETPVASGFVQLERDEGRPGARVAVR